MSKCEPFDEKHTFAEHFKIVLGKVGKTMAENSYTSVG